MKTGSGTSHLWKSWRNKCEKRNLIRSLPIKAERKQNSTYLAVKAERKCGSGTSHFWQSMQTGSADVELQIFGSQGRAEVRKRNIKSLAVKAEQKCGSGISDFQPSRQNESAEAALQIFDNPVKLDVWKQIVTSLTGPYPTDCHYQC